MEAYGDVEFDDAFIKLLCVLAFVVNDLIFVFVSSVKEFFDLLI